MGRERIDKEGGGGLSRRDFLKASAAAAAVGGLEMSWAQTAAANIQEGMVEGADYVLHHTTCPYCSASCGQIVATITAAGAAANKTGTTDPKFTKSDGLTRFTEGDVIDIWGDSMSPINQGGLCAKGAGALQQVTNPRRLAAFSGTHSVNPKFAYDSAYDARGVAYKRTGDSDWDKIYLDDAMGEIATALVNARGTVDAANGYNSKGVAFLGSSHMNNEQNNTYRKMIAQFGSSNVEHQARI